MTNSWRLESVFLGAQHKPISLSIQECSESSPKGDVPLQLSESSPAKTKSQKKEDEKKRKKELKQKKEQAKREKKAMKEKEKLEKRQKKKSETATENKTSKLKNSVQGKCKPV